jgi:hypothetical protein
VADGEAEDVDDFLGVGSEQVCSQEAPVPSSMRVLKPVWASFSRRELNQPVVSSWWVVYLRPCAEAAASVSPTRASGGVVNTTVGTPS